MTLCGADAIELLQHAHDLGELGHEVRLVLQPPGRVDQEHVGAFVARARERIVGDSGRVGAHLLGHHLRADASAPHFELIDGGGTERVARREHDAQTLRLEVMGELADGRGLAGAVHANHQHDMGPCRLVRREGMRQGLEHARDLGGEHCSHRLRRNAPLVAALGDDLADAARHGDAEIGLDQHLFELIERLLVELTLGQRAREIVRECRGASRQPLAKLGEPAPLRLLRRSLYLGTLRRTLAVGRLVLGRAIARRLFPRGLLGRRLLLRRARLGVDGVPPPNSRSTKDGFFASLMARPRQGAMRRHRHSPPHRPERPQPFPHRA